MKPAGARPIDDPPDSNFPINPQISRVLKARQYLESVDELEFNVFEFAKSAENEGLTSLLVFLFEENDLFEKLNIEFQSFFSFMKKIQSG